MDCQYYIPKRGSMMEPKILFVKQFLATLCEKKVTTIPINNKKFKDGIQSMADYYHSNAGSFGPYADALDMLFLKYSTRGDFSQFSKIIEGFNGRIVSLENPHYIKANLKLEKDYIEDLKQDKELGISHEQFQVLADCFISGADM